MKSSEKTLGNNLLMDVIDLEVLTLLLRDQTTGQNIIWATNDYMTLGEAFFFEAPIELTSITGEYCNVIKSRVEKNAESKEQRTKDKRNLYVRII